jgi:hypothetical protein
MAPALSSRDAGRAGQDLPSEERTAPLSAGLQRLSSALQGGTGSLAAYQSSQPNPATDNVNWYGIGQGTETASPPVAQSSGAANIDALQTAAAANVDLNQLQLVLSEAVTQPMQLWSLQPIYESARYYVEHGGSAIERGRARLLMERIEEFAELAARSGYLALNRTSLTYSGSDTSGSNATGASGAIMLASTSSGSISGVVQSDFDRAIGGDSSYDATGWLVPVIAASAGQPSHALTDDTGKILSYVSPVPGPESRSISQSSRRHHWVARLSAAIAGWASSGQSRGPLEVTKRRYFASSRCSPMDLLHRKLSFAPSKGHGGDILRLGAS